MTDTAQQVAPRRNRRSPAETWSASPTAKRAFDLVIAGLALVVLLPLLSILAFVVLVGSGRPVFFGHERVGRNGMQFRVWKFRTMQVDAEQRLIDDPHLGELYRQHGHKIPASLDPRITKLGRFLRATTLDELPQLWNVIRGDMSMVGPRPITAPELDHYGTAANLYMTARPGMTGPWQVSNRSSVDYARRVELDVDYLTRWNWLRDVQIVLRTLPAVWARRSAD